MVEGDDRDVQGHAARVLLLFLWKRGHPPITQPSDTQTHRDERQARRTEAVEELQRLVQPHYCTAP